MVRYKYLPKHLTSKTRQIKYLNQKIRERMLQLMQEQEATQ
jgi:hypothetical protein